MISYKKLHIESLHLCKLALHGVLLFYLFLPKSTFGQNTISKKTNPIHNSWKKLREENNFQRSKNFKGIEGVEYTAPVEMSEEPKYQNGYGSSYSQSNTYQGTPLSQKQLQSGKSSAGKGGAGNMEEDPAIDPAEEIEIPEIDEPDLPDPGIDIDAPSIPWSFWEILGIIFLILLIAFVIYQIVKNFNPPQGKQKLAFEELSEDINPVTIPKSELELRLEEAKNNGNYKECVRIYFLFALKHLIQEGRIFWKKDKTNMHYIIEMSGKKGAHSFEQMVNVYDVVWYGDYEINENAFSSIEPKLVSSYQQIEQS
jgi:hypothetical protein